jgi:hypothetical protein
MPEGASPGVPRKSFHLNAAPQVVADRSGLVELAAIVSAATIITPVVRESVERDLLAGCL